MASVGVQAAQCVMKEFPNENIVHEIELDRKKASIAFVNAAEEAERKRRISESEHLPLDTSLENKVTKLWVNLCEEEEKYERVLGLLSLKDELGQETTSKQTGTATKFKKPSGPSGKTHKKTMWVSKNITQLAHEKETNLDLAYVRIKEEEERARRVAVEGYLDELEDKYRANDKAYVHIKEEEERARRMAEEGYLKEVELERRKDNQAYAVIKEEEERARRIAENSWLEELERKQREENKGYVIVKEEEERARRIAEQGYIQEAELKQRLANRKLSAKLEEQERSRRLKEKPTASELSNLHFFATTIAAATKKKLSGQYLPIAKFKTPSHKAKSFFAEQEDIERRRRIHAPPSAELKDLIKKVGIDAATAATAKFGGEKLGIFKFKKGAFSKDIQVRHNFIRQLEEQERLWRQAHKLSEQDKERVKKIATMAAEAVNLRNTGAPSKLAKFKKTDITKDLEEKERNWRMKNQLSQDRKMQLKSLSESVANAASKKSQGGKLSIAKFKLTKKPSKVLNTKSMTRALEEKERQRRMNEPITGKQMLLLKNFANAVAAAARTGTYKGNKRIITKFKTPVKKLRDNTKILEERERKRRMMEKPTSKQLEQTKMLAHMVVDSVLKTSTGYGAAPTKFKAQPSAERERKRRIRQEKEKPDIITKIRGIAHNIRESFDKRRKGQKVQPAKFKRSLWRRRDKTLRLEEVERERRMRERPSADQLAQLKKNAQLVAQSSGKLHKPATFQRPSVTSKNKIRKLEEEERRRRMATPLTKEQKLELKSLSNSVAQAARQWKPVQAPKKAVWRKTVTKGPAPTTAPVKEIKTKTVFHMKEAESATGLEQPMEVRKGIVDKLSHELFDRISSRVMKERR